MRWRRGLRIVHRDVGYLCVGLTIVYAVSGVAVNHREDWDYNFSRRVEERNIGTPEQLLSCCWSPPAGQPWPEPTKLAREQQSLLVERLLVLLGRSDKPYKILWRGHNRITLLFGRSDRDLADYLPTEGMLVTETKRERFLLRQFNLLHLNEPAGLWTWGADLFAVALLFLALSGALMVRGRKGLRGRGALLVGAGILIPVVTLLIL